MFSLLIALPLLGGIVVFLFTRRAAAAGALLLVVLFANLSDVGIRYHSWPSVAQPLLLVFAAIAVVRQARSGQPWSFATDFWCAAGVYLAVVVASAIWAVNESAASHQAANLGKALVVVYIIVELFDSSDRQRLAIWGLVGAGTVLAAISIVQAATHTYDNAYLGLAQSDVRQLVGTANGYRSGGPIADPNFFGLTLASLVPLSALRWWDENRLTLRVVALAATSLLAVGVVLTYSRGALIALGVAAAGLSVALKLPVRRLLLVCAVVAVSLAAIAPAHYMDRLTNVAHSDHSFRGRIDSEYVATTIFVDHPVLGVGADNYQARYAGYAQQLHAVDAASTVHDLYLAVASETGLVGLLAFGAAILAVFRRSWYVRVEALRVGDRAAASLVEGSSLALVTYLTGCLFVPIAYPRYLWMFAGLALSVAVRARGSR